MIHTHAGGPAYNFQIASPCGARQVKVTVIGAGSGASSRDNNQWSGARGAGGGAAIKTYSPPQLKPSVEEGLAEMSIVKAATVGSV